VVGNIEFAIHKPLEERFFGPFKGLLPWFKPVQFFCHVVPELEAIFQGPRIKLLVVIKTLRVHVCSNICILNRCGRWWKDPSFQQEGVGILKAKVTHSGLSSLSYLLC